MTKTLILHPFLVEIELTTPTLTEGDSVQTMWRLVFGVDKNMAHEKTDAYLKNTYITNPDTTYHISVKDTIE